MRIEDGEVESFPLLRSVATPLGRARRGRAGQDREPAGRERDAILRSGRRLPARRGRDAVRLDRAAIGGLHLRGKGSVDLVESALEGKAAMTFSAELSELMRAEDSRAAELFWSEGSTARALHVRAGRERGPRQSAAFAPWRSSPSRARWSTGKSPRGATPSGASVARSNARSERSSAACSAASRRRRRSRAQALAPYAVLDAATPPSCYSAPQLSGGGRMNDDQPTSREGDRVPLPAHGAQRR